MTENIVVSVVAVFILIVVIIGGCFGLMGVGSIYAKYNVWSSGMAGKAQLAQAEYNRQIQVREAVAKRDSAVMLAQAEVERAKGVAQANKIIGDSLRDNQDYLRYLWIQNLQNDKNQVIYVPTEANLPILEATRLNKIKPTNEGE